MYLLGIDVGSSSVKVSLIDALTHNVIDEVFSPEKEMVIDSPESGFAEQDPMLWWNHFKLAYAKIIKTNNLDSQKIYSIGISYQMHGLVVVDKNGQLLRKSIIWCDSRAVSIGDQAYNANLDYCHNNLFNSPANLTLSKLVWVKNNQPEIYNQIYKFMLPGDFLAFKLSGQITTTPCGLTECILWDYKENSLATKILDYWGIDKSKVPDIIPNFTDQLKISNKIADELNLSKDIYISYRAGDQPNNAFGLKVLNSGEVAANAGTSGVIYALTNDAQNFDNRANQILHINDHYQDYGRKIGILMCMNGVGILNSWLKHNILDNQLDYSEMNESAQLINPGSDGLLVIPYGNGAERTLYNKNPYAHILNIDFNRHKRAHLIRATLEGIAYSLNYAIDIVRDLGLEINTIKAGYTNMFLSPIFRNTLAKLAKVNIELYNTNGSLAAGLASGVGAKIYATMDEALKNIQLIQCITPDLVKDHDDLLEKSYNNWRSALTKFL